MSWRTQMSSIPLDDLRIDAMATQEAEVTRASACLIHEGSIRTYGALVMTQLRLVYLNLSSGGDASNICFARGVASLPQLGVRSGDYLAKASAGALSFPDAPPSIIYQRDDGFRVEFGVAAQIMPAADNSNPRDQFLHFSERFLIDTSQWK